MSTINYINDAKKKMGIQSDYAFCKALQFSQPALSLYRNGKRIIDDYTAAKLAEILDINPLEVIAAANAEREKDLVRREMWLKLARTSAEQHRAAKKFNNVVNRMKKLVIGREDGYS